MVTKVKTDKSSAKQEFFTLIKHLCPEFKVDDDNREILSQISDWCFRIKQPLATLDPEKGLWLYGYVGSGKSLMMDVVLTFIKHYWVRRNYPYEKEKLTPTSIDITKLCLRYAKEGFAAFEKIPVGLDEVGTERGGAQYMGNQLNVFGYVIEELSKSKPFIPHIVTTNLSFGEVLHKYGPRVIDRIGMLFNPILFQGESHRPSKEIWNLIQMERDAN